MLSGVVADLYDEGVISTARAYAKCASFFHHFPVCFLSRVDRRKTGVGESEASSNSLSLESSLTS